MRTLAVAVGVVAALGVMAPVFSDVGDDAYPISGYTMFANPIEAENRVHLVVGVDDGGDRVTLTPEIVAGTDEVIHAVGVVTAAVHAGESAQLCEEAARRAAAKDLRVREIVVVTDTYDAVAYFSGEREPITSVERARCEVMR